jgi:DNA-directed RNA polymerase specialized sigma24 family protein
MNSQPEGVVIDAALRFARSNPDLLRYAHENAGTAGASADDLLREAIERVVASRRESGLRRVASR